MSEKTQTLWSLVLAVLGVLAGIGVGRNSVPSASIPAITDDSAHTAPTADPEIVELSAQAERSLRLETGLLAKSTFRKTISIPGTVTIPPGQNRKIVTTHLEGLVTRIDALQGEAIGAEVPLYELRLTQEHLLQGQTELLRTVEELDVVSREIARLKPLAESGSSPLKTLLDQQYHQQRLTAGMRAQRQALLLHELKEEHIDYIVKERKLINRFQEFSPPQSQMGKAPFFVVDRVLVNVGQYVNPGDSLMELIDLSELYVEANAFEQDLPAISRSLKNHWKVVARCESQTSPTEPLEFELPIFRIDDSISPQDRTAHFYCRLENVVVRDVSHESHRFVNWLHKPGQRVQLRVPVEEWKDQFVVPASAVAQDGAETYVFRRSKNGWKRRSVQIVYRDPQSAVVVDDGSLVSGNTIAINCGQQLLTALKNAAGGGAEQHHHHDH